MAEKVKPVPPSELVTQCDELNNKWLTDKAILTVYLSGDSDFGDQWRFRIRDKKTHELIVEHLVPEYANGHNYYMMVSAAQEAYKRGLAQGHLRAMARMFDSMCNTIGVTKTAAKEFLIGDKHG